MGKKMPLTLAVSVVAYALLLRAFMPVKSASCSSPGQPSFLTQPSDVIVKGGGNASFTCSVSDYNPDTDSLLWEVTPTLFYSLMSREFDASTHVMTSTITFINVSRTGQTQKCVLYILNDKGQLITCRSRTATISIQYFPGKEDITCGPKKLQALHDGQVLPIWCKVPLGNPPVELTWHILGTEGKQGRTYQQQEIQTTTQEVHVNRLVHDRTATCEATSRIAFPNQTLTCNIGPFIVHYKPKVHLSLRPSAADASFKQGEAIELNCTADAYPDITQLFWMCTPTDVVGGCTVAGNTVVLDTSEIHIDTSFQLVVKCTVQNPVGISEASINITVLPSPPNRNNHMCQDYSLTVTQLNTEHSFLNAGWNVTFLCSVVGPKFDTEKHRFLWYSDNVMMENTSVDVYPLHGKTIGQSAVQLINVFETENCKSVTCELMDENCPQALSDAVFMKLFRQSLCDQDVTGDTRNATLHNSKDPEREEDPFHGATSNSNTTLLLNTTMTANLSMRFTLILVGTVTIICIFSFILILFFKHLKHRSTAASTGQLETHSKDGNTFISGQQRDTEIHQRAISELSGIYEDPTLISCVEDDYYLSSPKADADYDDKIFESNSLSSSYIQTSSMDSWPSYTGEDSSSEMPKDTTSDSTEDSAVHQVYQNQIIVIRNTGK